MTDDHDHDDPFAGLSPAEEPDAPPPDDPADLAAALQACAQEPINDFGNGRRFAHHFGRDAMHVPRYGWHVWGGAVWDRDDDELVMRARAQELSDLIVREIPYLALSAAERAAVADKGEVVRARAELTAIPTADRTASQKDELAGLGNRLAGIERIEKTVAGRRGRHRSFATTTGNSGRIDNALREAAVALARPFEALDATPLDVNTQSGVLRFSVEDMRDDGAGKVATVALVPHDRDQLLTKIMPVAYDPGAACPQFDAFLDRVQPDPEIRAFLQRWFGLSMTGTPVQRLVFLHGAGANGKSVLVDLMARVFGNYAATARIETLTGTNRRAGNEATPDLIPLMGARMVRTSEPDEGQRLQEGLIKELTGGEPIMVRPLHGAFIEVKPFFKLTMSGNHKPEIRGTDDGIWRRLFLVPFTVQIPEAERDPDLGQKLWAEAPGILNWAIAGLIDVLEGGLAPPEAVSEATREYRAESDPIGTFLAQCCVVTGVPADTIRARDLGHAFLYFLMERGLNPWTIGTFNKQMPKRAGVWRHPATGQTFTKGKASVSQYVGLRLNETFKRRFDEAPKDAHGAALAVSAAPDPDEALI